MIEDNTPSLLDLKDREFSSWYIIFGESKVDYWWTRYLLAGFCHVHAMKWTPFGWLYFDVGWGYTEVDMILARTTDPWELNPCAEKIVKVSAWREHRCRIPQTFQATTCVEGVKSLLGIKKYWLFTPFQLYKYLLRSNGKYFQSQEV